MIRKYKGEKTACDATHAVAVLGAIDSLNSNEMLIARKDQINNVVEPRGENYDFKRKS